MKAAIAAEVARKELADDIKRGPGGIREIEFLVQALQLIRGGREPALRERRLLPALRRWSTPATSPPIPASRWPMRIASCAGSRTACRCCAMRRRTRCRERLDRARLARGLDYRRLGRIARRARRATRPRGGRVRSAARAAPDARAAPSELAALLARAARCRRRAGAGRRGLRRQSRTSTAACAISRARRACAPCPTQPARGWIACCRRCSKRPRSRRNPMPRCAACCRCCTRCCAAPVTSPCSTNSPRRSPGWSTCSRAARCWPNAWARIRCCSTNCSTYAWPAPCRIAPHSRPTCETPAATTMSKRRCMALNELRQALSFRIALATLMRASLRRTARGSWRGWPTRWSRRAALARREMERAHGAIAAARFAVLGYGSLGGEELGFGSDLDLVFLYDAAPDAQSDGARALDAPRWFARLAQKIVALLGTVTGAGRLYEVDVRLRPDGAKGLLVSSLASFAEYQRERAWTWEHQALVRARGVAGDAALVAEFERVRGEDAGAGARCRDPARRSHRDARRCARSWIAAMPRASTSSRARVGWSTWNSCCSCSCSMRGRRRRWLAPRDTPGLLRVACAATRWWIARPLRCVARRACGVAGSGLEVRRWIGGRGSWRRRIQYA